MKFTILMFCLVFSACSELKKEEARTEKAEITTVLDETKQNTPSDASPFQGFFKGHVDLEKQRK